MVEEYNRMAIKSSKLLTNCYSTSFSLGIRALAKEVHNPIYAIYGFVRLADEIVDTFHDLNQEQLLDDFEEKTFKSLINGMDTNPILHSFQGVVNKYKVDHEYIKAFLKSMRFDLNKKSYQQADYEEYIYGSAEVVGLMCLRVFCHKQDALFHELIPFAKSLGSAFQKVNFLRDLKADYEWRERSYFPNVKPDQFSIEDKKRIEKEIQKDFDNAYSGIVRLPKNSKFGVYTAYIYYLALFKKIESLEPEEVMQRRIRIPNSQKYLLLLSSWFRYQLGWVK